MMVFGDVATDNDVVVVVVQGVQLIHVQFSLVGIALNLERNKKNCQTF